MRVNVDRKTEITRQVVADFLPRIAGIVGAHHVPVLLHEERVRTRWVHRDAMNAMTNLRIRIGNVL